jgi:hypothetical protein
MTCVPFSAGLCDGEWPRFKSTIFASFFRVAPRACCNITLTTRFRIHKMHPILHFCCRLAIILDHKIRPDGSSTVGKSLLRRVHAPQNASDPSFHPFVMLLAFFLAICCRLAVILDRKIRPDGSSTVGKLLYSYDAFTDRKMHPILHFIHSLCFLRCFWPFVVAWRSFWTARFVRTDRPRPAIKAPDSSLHPNAWSAVIVRTYHPLYL